MCSQKVKDDGLMFLWTLFVRTESETMKYMGEFECCWRYDWAMCVFLCRLMSVSETQLFRGQRNWNILRS